MLSLAHVDSAFRFGDRAKIARISDNFEYTYYQLLSRMCARVLVR